MVEKFKNQILQHRHAEGDHDDVLLRGSLSAECLAYFRKQRRGKLLVCVESGSLSSHLWVPARLAFGLWPAATRRRRRRPNQMADIKRGEARERERERERRERAEAMTPSWPQKKGERDGEWQKKESE